MALQWMILSYVVVAEVALAIVLTLPSPKAIQSRIASLVSQIVQPSLFIVPFAAFQLLDIYWKSEHRLKCIGEACTIADRLRSERASERAARKANILQMATIYTIFGGTLLNIGITFSSEGGQAIANGSFVAAGVFLTLFIRSMQRVKNLDKFEKMI